MIHTGCPNCGNTVTFHSEFSTHAVCAFCDSLIIRSDSGFEDLGKVAELQPDDSPLQVGTEGVYKKQNFQIVGRIQLSYEDGYWNEWHIILSDGSSGWIGEAMGEYFVSFQVDVRKFPKSSELKTGTSLHLEGTNFAVTGRTLNEISSYEGELPFIVKNPKKHPAFDLRSTTRVAATIEYSESPPLLFVGEYVPFDELKFRGLRSADDPPDPSKGQRIPATSSAVENFNCPSCGAPHTVSGGFSSKMLVCEFCGSAVDITTSNLRVLWQEKKSRALLQQGTAIKLGAQATLPEGVFTCIGLLKKSVVYEGVKYPWTEYLLHNFTYGYRWLVESNGHFTLMENMPEVPAQRNGKPVAEPSADLVRYQGSYYRHFQTSKPRVDALAGEFYWRVRVGDIATNYDYVYPPYTISAEDSEYGLVWVKGEYKTPKEINEMFGGELSLKSPTGVAPCQPNPHIKDSKVIWPIFLVAIVLCAALLMSGILTGGPKTMMGTSGHYFPEDAAGVTEPFEITGRGNLAIVFSSGLGSNANRWLFVETVLTNVETQKTYRVGQTLERYYGEGSNNKQVRLSGVPNGTYVLRWEVKTGTTSKTPQEVRMIPAGQKFLYRITVKRGEPVWTWFFLLVVALGAVPLIVGVSSSSFETNRWYESDYG